MGNQVAVGIWYTTDDLSEEKPGIFFADVVVLNVVVELASFCQFHDDEDVIGGV